MGMSLNILINRCIKIFYISRKPTNSEFWEVAKITSIGMIAIGIVGLLISLIMNIGV